MTNHSGAGKSPGRDIALLPSSSVEWVVAGTLFLLALGLALHHDWSKIELFWTVWIASLSVVTMLLLTAYIAFAVTGLRHAVATRSGLSDWAWGIVVYLTAIAGSAIPLGGIYWFTARFVSSAILDEPDARISLVMVGELLETYWLIVLAGLVARAMDAAAMMRTNAIDQNDRTNALLDMVRTAAISSSGFFLATFMFVFAVLFAHALKLDPGWWLYTLVFAAFYILPARPAPTRKPDRAESVLDEKTLAELSTMFREPVLSLGGRKHRYPDYRSLFASPEFSRFAEGLRHAGEEDRLKAMQIFLTQKVLDERQVRRGS